MSRAKGRARAKKLEISPALVSHQIKWTNTRARAKCNKISNNLNNIVRMLIEMLADALRLFIVVVILELVVLVLASGA